MTAIALLTGCTSWGVAQTFGRPREVGRTMVGAPMVETRTDTSISGGYAGSSYRNGYGSRSSVGGFAGEGGSVSRTHCVQQAQIDYVQDIDSYSVITGRGLDVAGGISLGLLGLIVVAVASDGYDGDLRDWEWDRDQYVRDPDFWPHPGTSPGPPNTAYAVGAGISVLGLGLLVYSLAVLPKGEAPPPSRKQHTWTEPQYVEATGCGIVPADQVPPQGYPQQPLPPQPYPQRPYQPQPYQPQPAPQGGYPQGGYQFRAY